MTARIFRVLCLVFVCLALSGGSYGQSSACFKCDLVQTGTVTTCFECVAAGSGVAGGTRCTTPACSTCRLTNPCKDRPSGGGDDDPHEPVLQSALRLDHETIKQIAARHPRFAATFAVLHEFGGVNTRWSLMHWVPVDLDESVVEALLDPEAMASKPILKKFEKRSRAMMQRVARKEKAPAVYEILVEDLGDGKQVLTIKVIDAAESDPPFTELRLSLIPVKDAPPVILSWNIR